MNIKCMNGRSFENKGLSDSFSCCSLLDDCTFPLCWDERPPALPGPPAEMAVPRLWARVPGFRTALPRLLPSPAAPATTSKENFRPGIQPAITIFEPWRHNPTDVCLHAARGEKTQGAQTGGKGEGLGSSPSSLRNSPGGIVNLMNISKDKS